MEQGTVPTGSRILDKMLNGGYDSDIITTIYGPAGSGKTTLGMLCAVGIARQNKKVVYVDSEGGFSVERLKQIAPDYENILKKFIFLRPITFNGQKRAFEKLKDLVRSPIGLIIVDTIAMLYRLELGTSEKVYETNRELGKQISFLTQIARKEKIPVLVMNQVYSDFENKDKVNMVGGDLMKYGSKCLIELQITQKNNRKAIIKKHRSISENKYILFKPVQGGILGTKE